MELSRACSFVHFFCTAKQHKTALSFLVFRVIAAHVNPISTPQHTRYRGPHKRALSMQRSVANPPTDSLALQRETPVAHIDIALKVGLSVGCEKVFKPFSILPLDLHRSVEPSPQDLEFRGIFCDGIGMQAVSSYVGRSGLRSSKQHKDSRTEEVMGEP